MAPTQLDVAEASSVEMGDYDCIVLVVPFNTTNTSSVEGLGKRIEEHSTFFDDMLEKKLKASVVKVTVAREDGSMATKCLSLFEIGEKDGMTTVGRKLGQQVASTLKAEKGIKRCAVILPESVSESTALISEFASSVLSGFYIDNRFKSQVEDEGLVKSIDVIVEGRGDLDEIRDAIRRSHVITEGVYLSKDIVNAPHNTLNSVSLAETAGRIADESGGRLTLRVLDFKDCEKRGMGAYLGVARGSETFPKFLHLTYRPKKRGTKKNPL